MGAQPMAGTSLGRLRAAGWSPVAESWTFPGGRRARGGTWHRAAELALGEQEGDAPGRFAR
jgi:hypothetical protein